MRTPIRPSLFLAVAAGAWLAAPTAHAQTNCDPVAEQFMCSNGPANQKFEYSEELPTSLTTGWVPDCPGGGHCDDESIQVQFQVLLVPPNTGGPLITVDMSPGPLMDARWVPTETTLIDLSLATGRSTEGTFSVAHGMRPEFGLYIDTPIYTGEITIDASTLINYIPGSQFNYIALNSTKFAPWGFTRVDCDVRETDLNNSQLFSVTFEQLGNLVGQGGFNDYLEGAFSFNAISDITFSYTTSQVKVRGVAEPIPFADGKIQVATPYQDALVFVAHTEGTIRYVGTFELLPVIQVDSVGGIGISLDFPISVGLDFPLDEANFPVVFPGQEVHIPLPNVFVPSSLVGFSPPVVRTGDRSPPKTVVVDNTGELDAILTITSSDPSQFPVGQGSAQMAPKTNFNLEVSFRPTSPGRQEGRITVTSNDPDTPVQEFDVWGDAEGEEIPDYDAGAGGSAGAPVDSGPPTQGATPAEDDGGCGCRTVSSQTTQAGAALALLGLGLGLMRRRR